MRMFGKNHRRVLHGIRNHVMEPRVHEIKPLENVTWSIENRTFAVYDDAVAEHRGVHM
jgi:hypothetical protein